MATNKVTRLLAYLLFRVVLPLSLLIACVVRPNVLSFIYGILLLLTPLCKSPTPESIKGGTGNLLKAILGIGVITVLAQSIFHIVLAAIATDEEPYGHVFGNCSSNEELVRQFGFQRLDNVPAKHVARLVGPDILVCFMAILVFAICSNVLKETTKESDLPTVTKTRKRRMKKIIDCSKMIALMLFLAASGIIVPSIIGSVYFFTFLIAVTWWSFGYSLGTKFSILKFFILVYVGLHLCVLYLYQFPFFNKEFLAETMLARLLGITQLVYTDCAIPWDIELHSDQVFWPGFVNPGILLLLYWILAFQCRHFIYSKSDRRLVSDSKLDATVPKRRTRRRRYSGTERQGLVDTGENMHYSSVDPISSGDIRVKGGEIEAQEDSDEEMQATVESRKHSRTTEKRSAFASVLVYIMNQSYVLALIAMMAWSITFHSWLTFVLLLGACIIWMIPKSRRACLLVSPVIVFYAEVLLIIQYIYGLKLNEDELPTELHGMKMSEIGLIKFDIPCRSLALQTFYTLVFLLTLRQHMRERHLKKETSIQDSPMDSDLADGYDGYTIKQIGRYLWSLLCKYWIFICAGMMLTIAIQDEVAYRLIYLIFFLYFIIAFQLSYRIWRVTMYVFWWVVIIYSMCVLCMIYTYQFSQFPSYWKNGTGLSEEILRDLGLQQYDVKGLFVKLLTPTSFLIVIIIQVHYFHQPFMHLSGLERYRREFANAESIDVTAEDGHITEDTGLTTSDTESELRMLNNWRKEFVVRFRALWRRGSATWNYVSQYLWRLIEIHIFKVVGLTVMVVAVKEVSAISAVYVIMLAFFLPLPKGRLLLSHILQMWTALVLLAKASFQMSVARIADWQSNCTMKAGNNTIYDIYPFNHTIDNNIWIGLEKVKSTELPNYLQNYVVILIVIAFQSVIRYHQEQHYNHPKYQKPNVGIIFTNIQRTDADKGIVECFKYFANYFFYKFGLELCYIITAIAISVRVDAYSVLYAIFLGVLLLLNRRGNAYLWPIYVLVLTILLPLQYMSSIGAPMGLCLSYPWANTLKLSLQQWLFLPSYTSPPAAPVLLADFFQLLFACLQWRVFYLESRTQAEEYGGGLNKDILAEVESNAEIPVPDFTTTVNSYLDVAKYAIFYYLFWVTMAIVFFAGTNRINLFGLGYVIIVFCFMWFGREFLLKPLRKLLWWWNFLVGYTFLVLFTKASLQLVGCVYKLKNDSCLVIKLFGITCLSPNIEEPNSTCSVDKNGLLWDVICFAFLLLQRRVYSSHYFRHIVAELEAQRRLASRGAELINRILIREVLLQKERERGILNTIKKKMEELKAKQARLKKNYQEPEEHYQAIRSGDYYLFEDDSDDDSSSPDQAATSLNLGRSERSSEERKMGPLQLLSTAIDSGTDTALEKAKEEEQLERRLSMRRSSSIHKEEMPFKKSFQAEPSPIVVALEDADAAAPPVFSEDADPPKKEEEQPSPETQTPDTLFSKISNNFCLFIAILVSMANWLIKIFNHISRNYRHVARILADDMKKEKLKIQAEKQGQVFVEPDTNIDEAQDEGATDNLDNGLIAVTVESPTKSDVRKCLSKTSLDDMEDDEENEFEMQQPVLYRLLVAFYYMLISRSELVCYFLIVLNQMVSASLLSLPLPLMVFLWGMLSVPRPSKTFWVTVITYTEAVVVVKYLFQFTIFPWIEVTNQSPFWPPRILGIEYKKYYANYDLALLLILFIHRTILKRYGLWKDAEDINADLEKAEGKELSPPCTPTLDSPLHSSDLVHVGQELDAGQEIEADGIDTSSQKGTLVIDESSTAPKRKTKKSFLANLETSVVSCLQPFQNFYRQMTNSTYNAVVDVYAPMFACDFLAFLIVVFGYWAFGPVQSSGGDVTTYIQENRVPIPFLVMLVVQFMLIIIDRALFLRKYVQGKFIFQVALVIIGHIWLFFILPAVTERQFVQNTPAMLWYFVKCIYFALSAYQIRSGYPTRILGNFLTKNYSYLNLFLFKGFLAIPFLLELRALMDWMWTDTTLALSSWLQMEDIYANIFVLKCWRHAEVTYPTPRAQKRKSTIKYGVGGLLLLLIIFIIWFPLVLFSFANTVYEPNPPITCTVTISMGGYQPLFKMTSQQQNIHSINHSQYVGLQETYKKRYNALGFVTSYNKEDISIVTVNGESTSVWGISPPSQKKLLSELMESNSFNMELLISFTRNKSSLQSSEIVSNQFHTVLNNATTKHLAALISGNTTESVNITNLFYPFLKLQNNGQVTTIPFLLEGTKPYLSLSIHRGKLSVTSGEVEWWQVVEVLPSDLKLPDIKSNTSKLIFYTFNDRVAPAGFSVITGYGIIGLYVSMVFVIGRFARLFVSEVSYRIMFMELPYIDKILKLCLDIYLVRECCDFRLEEDLFAKLLFLYRSPETMIRWTKMKRE